MNLNKFILCTAVILLFSAHANAIDKQPHAAFYFSETHSDPDVGSHLQANQITRNSTLDTFSHADVDTADRSPRAASPLTEVDIWLMALVGAGLIVLQLRRKQKTLPQRPLITTV